jgi:integrase/recombinase XerD
MLFGNKCERAETRYAPLHAAASGLVTDYLEAAANGSDEASPLFHPLHKSRDHTNDQAIKATRAWRSGFATAMPIYQGGMTLRSSLVHE